MVSIVCKKLLLKGLQGLTCKRSLTKSVHTFIRGHKNNGLYMCIGCFCGHVCFFRMSVFAGMSVFFCMYYARMSYVRMSVCFLFFWSHSVCIFVKPVFCLFCIYICIYIYICKHVCLSLVLQESFCLRLCLSLFLRSLLSVSQLPGAHPSTFLRYDSILIYQR